MDIDINTFGSYPLAREEDQDAMDTSLDLPQNDERTVKGIEPGATDIAMSQSSEAVLERPREGEIQSGVLDQKGKTSSRILSCFRCRFLG